MPKFSRPTARQSTMCSRAITRPSLYTLAALVRGKVGQGRVAEDAAFGEVHQIKWRADHRGVFAEEVCRDHRHIALPQSMHDAVLAFDHVRGGQQSARRLLAQHEPAVAGFHQKSGIGLPAAELTRRQRARYPLQVARQIMGEAVNIELMSGRIGVTSAEVISGFRWGAGNLGSERAVSRVVGQLELSDNLWKLLGNGWAASRPRRPQYV